MTKILSKLGFTSQKTAATAALRKWNLVLAAVHAVQGVAIVLLSTAKTLPVYIGFAGSDVVAANVADRAQQTVPATMHWFDMPLPWLLAAVFFVLALGHLAVATVWRKRYEADLAQRTQCVRWIVAAITASALFVIALLLVGVSDSAALVGVAACGVVVAATAALLETTRNNRRIIATVGLFATVVPWVVIIGALVAANTYGGYVATYVYALLATLLVGTGLLMANAYLSYLQKRAWSEYFHTERLYMLLCAGVTTAIAWQLYAGLLRP